MLKREFVKPKTGEACVLFREPMSGYIYADYPKTKSFRNCVKTEPTTEGFHDAVEKHRQEGWKETPASQSRRMLVLKDEDKGDRFWAVELDDRSLLMNYGKVPSWGWWPGTGTSKVLEYDTEAEAKYQYAVRLAKKLEEGFADIEPRETAYTSLVDNPPPKPAAKKKAAAKKTAKKKEAPVEEEIVLDVSSEIALLPRDWCRATFRTRKPLPLPEETPFDHDECKRRVCSLKRTGSHTPFDKLNPHPGLSAEEAHFWWLLLTGGSFHVAPREMVKWVRPESISGRVTTREAKDRLAEGMCLPEAMPALYRLIGHDAFIKLALSTVQSKAQHHYHGHEPTTPLAHGFVTHIAPYLDNDKIEDVRRQVKSKWKSLKPPLDFYHAFPSAVYLAAGIGLWDELLDLVAGWEDGFYGKDSWNDFYQRPQEIVLGLGSPELVVHHWRRLGLRMNRPEHVRGFLACTELSELDFVAESICSETNKETAADLVEAFSLVRAPEAAQPMLYCMQNSKAPNVARAWLYKYVGNGVTGLVETAAGKGKLAEGAVQYLRDVKCEGHTELIEAAIKSIDPDAAAKVRRDVIDHKEKTYTPFDDKSPPKWLAEGLAAAEGLKGKKRPSWAEPKLLPPLTVGDNCLNGDQLDTVLKTLQATILPKRHPLLDAIKEHVDEPHRDAFAWRLFERWMEDGTPSKEKWAFGAIGQIGGDESALRLTPLIRVWPGESQHPRAVLGLECLRGIGTDTALMQLNGIAQKLKFQGLKRKAREFMEQIAEDRGMSRSELEDLIVPDLGLDERGTRTFDFGPRSFQFVLKPDLKPAVRDESGKIRTDLPKPAAKDDEEKASAAVAEWKLLKKQLRDAVKAQIPRLEQAMVTGRRWSIERFESLIVNHPLMTNFARMLLWGGYDANGKLTGTFRVTEEQDYADVHDEPCDISGFHEVGVVHPLHLSNPDAAGWGEVFSDYEIVSPFAQLGRATYRIGEDEAKHTSLSRFDGTMIPALSLVGTLDRLGWARGVPEDGGVYHEHSKPFYGAEVTAVLEYEIGVPIGYMEGWEDQKLSACYFVPGIYTPQMYPEHRNAISLGKVDPVVLSEVLADLHALAAKAV